MTINLSRSILLIAQFGLVNYQDAKSNIACSPEVTCQSNSAYFCDTFKDRKGIGTRGSHPHRIFVEWHFFVVTALNGTQDQILA
ncbi:hypothetical protein D918_09459 [Trichuris suis]|nr:hypothetical protein D918_09459 [Trichuris suis]